MNDNEYFKVIIMNKFSLRSQNVIDFTIRC